MSKEIKVTCKGADILPIDALENFQGNLKKITKENLNKLKKKNYQRWNKCSTVCMACQ